MHRVIRQILGTCVAAGIFLCFGFVLLVSVVCRPRLRRSGASWEGGAGLRVLVTGRVNSENWCKAHLLPLVEAASVSQLFVVMDGPVICHEKISCCSRTRAAAHGRLFRRSWALFNTVRREKPHVLIGYSLFPAALLSLLVARVCGGAAIYQMTGGSAEIAAAGVSSDHPRFEMPAVCVRALRPLARRLSKAFDAVIVRGGRTRACLLEKAQVTRVEIIPGAVDPARFAALPFEERPHDIVFVGRLVAVKQPDQLLQVALRVRQQLGAFRGVIVGDGPLRMHMQQEAARLGLDGCLHFTGHLDRVEDVLNRSKIFLLTSRSEGLSIALAEAMMAGAVPVVADVGDLNELVGDGRTGWLIKPGDFDAYAARICQTLQDRALWASLSRVATSAAAANNALVNVARRWDECFRGILQTGAPAVAYSSFAPDAVLNGQLGAPTRIDGHR